MIDWDGDGDCDVVDDMIEYDLNEQLMDDDADECDPFESEEDE